MIQDILEWICHSGEGILKIWWLEAEELWSYNELLSFSRSSELPQGSNPSGLLKASLSHFSRRTSPASESTRLVNFA